MNCWFKYILTKQWDFLVNHELDKKYHIAESLGGKRFIGTLHAVNDDKDGLYEKTTP